MSDEQKKGKKLVKYTAFIRHLKVNEHNEFESRKVPITSLDGMLTKLYQALDGPESDLKALLCSDFVYPEERGQSDTTYPFDYRRQNYRSTFQPQQYKVVIQHHHYTAKVLEALAVDFNAEFRKLLQAANPRAKKILLDFTGMGLQGANFEGIDLEWANFTDADLTDTNITEEQLNECMTYLNTTLPEAVKNITPYWDAAKISEVKKQITELEEYGSSLIEEPDEKSRQKGKKAINHAFALTKMIDTERLNAKFQTRFLEKLHEHDKKFDEPRGQYKIIIANIGLAAVGLVVGYLLALAIHYKVTGRLGFLTQTATRERVEDIQNAATVTL